MPRNIRTPDREPPGPPRRFDAEPFRPDGVVPLGGLALLLVGVALTAVTLGFVLSFVGQWLYLPIIFAMVAGTLLGGAGRALGSAGRIRNSVVAGTVAALGALGMMYSMHYFDYHREIGNPAWQGRPPDNVFQYIDLEAQAGIVLRKLEPPGAFPGVNPGFNLGYVGSYVYFGLETFLAAGIALAIARTGASAPFCRACGAWKKVRTLAGLPFVTLQTAVAAVREGAVLDLLDAGAPLGRGDKLFLVVFVCPRCGGDGTVVVAVKQITVHPNGGKSHKIVGHSLYPGEVLALLDKQMPRSPKRAGSGS